MSEWQPIETVPKDGTIVLLAVVNREPWIDGWITSETSDGYWLDCVTWEDQPTPTHWMPLPAPPKKQDGV